LPIEPGTDLALLNGLLHLLIIDGTSITALSKTHGRLGKKCLLSWKAYTPRNVAEITGLDESAIRQAAAWIGESQEVMSLWTMGSPKAPTGTWHTKAS